MPRLVQTLSLKGNPFEHYVAETEPDIAEYAIKPPYFEAIEARASNTTSIVLFGDRGAGKSATRLTIFKEMWRQKGQGKRVPLAVNMTDFSTVIHRNKLHEVSEAALIKEVAFVVIESLLTWLSALEDEEREIFLGAMNDDEKTTCYYLLKNYYASRTLAKRERSIIEAMNLLNQAFLAKSRLWIEKRWEPITRLVASLTDGILHQNIGTEKGLAGAIGDVISAEPAEEIDSVLLLRRLVSLVNTFHFSGIVVLLDKIDETDATNHSADQSAALIHPLLSRVQLMEVPGFSWAFFLWTRVKPFFEGIDYPVRLDKIAHATVSWDDQFFAIMLDRRVKFFSKDRLSFAGLFDSSVDTDKVVKDLIAVSMRSPRELIRLMDITIREHDVAHASKEENVLLTTASVEAGLDKYVTDIISTVYGERLLYQIFRLNRTVFTNKEAQMTFRIGAQSARTRLQSWENAGIIKFNGTRAADGAQGGKPANEYVIVDARIERIMKRQLVTYEAAILDAEPDFLEELIE